MYPINSLNRKIQRLEDLHYSKSELELRRNLLRAMEIQTIKSELADAAGTDNQEFVDALFDAGFTAQTLPALSLAPVALVAWGSGAVTPEERDIAMRAIFDSPISGNAAAIAMFESWLDIRPDPNLFYLWANITLDKYRKPQAAGHDNHVDRVVQLPKQVALASGGFLGFGTICTGEQRVIDGISSVLNQALT